MTGRRQIGSWAVRCAAALVLAVAWGGCASRQGRASLELHELTQEELDRFLDSGADPRYRGITARRGASGVEFDFGNRPWMGKVARTPMEKVAGKAVPVVEAKTATRVAFNALVDTSARQSWFLYDSVKAMDYRPFKLEPGGRPIGERADHVRAEIPGYAGVANKTILEKLNIESPVFYVAPGHGMLGALARPESAPGGADGAAADKLKRRIHGVLGAALLKQFAFVQLDGPRGEILWASPPHKHPAPAGTASAPLLDWRGRPAVKVRLGGRETLAVIDTAGDFAVSVPDDWPGAGEGAGAVLEVAGRDLGAVPLATHGSLGLPGDWPVRVGWRTWRGLCIALDWAGGRFRLAVPGSAPPESGAQDGAGPAGGGPVRYRGIDP